MRELFNVIQCAMALSVTDTIVPADLSGLSASSTCALDETANENASLTTYKKEAICNALDQTSGNRRNAAKLLGISEVILYRWIKDYHL